jgi:integrase
VDDDPKGDAALQLWLEQRDDLLAGRTPPENREDLDVASLCNQFLTHKNLLVESDELAQTTFNRYLGTCKFLTQQFGRNRFVEDIRPDDFQGLRAVMAKKWGAVALGNEIQIVRSIFRFGYEAELIEKPVRFGPGFKKPSAKTLRKTRAANGPRMFTAEQINKLLEHATTNMRAMLLLGVNGGLGNTDVALIPLSVVDLDGWLNYPRQKTAVERRIPLWTETLDAIRDVMAERREPDNSDDRELLFIGKRGQNYIGSHKGYRVTAEFNRVAKWAGVERRTFYDLRRTFETIGGESRDQVAVDHIMGHAPPGNDMAAIYRQRVDDQRLLDVVNHVRRWLYPDAAVLKIADGTTHAAG